MEAQEEINILIQGNPATKKNSMQIIRIAGHPSLIPSKKYRAFEKTFLPQIRQEYKLRIDYPIQLRCLYYMETRRKVDLVNLLNATQDLLVKAGVLLDDNSSIVVSVDGSRVLYNKEYPRTEIYIIPIARRIKP